MNEFFEVTILSILQGVAEFLPISSSGHLVLGKSLLGMRDVGMRLDIFLHVGTLLAVGVFYFSVIWRVLSKRDWAYMGKIVLSAIPAGIVGILFKDPLEAAFASPHATGGCLIFTGIILTLTRFMPQGNGTVTTLRALWMGIAQAIAILPGVSRSGMTLTAARASGVNPAQAAEFSFLMSAPPIAGAAMLEVLKLGDLSGGTETGWLLTLWGGALAAVVGYFSLMFLVRVLKGRLFWLFGPYCFVVGLCTVLCT